jgi:hypothetical protein
MGRFSITIESEKYRYAIVTPEDGKRGQSAYGGDETCQQSDSR